VTAGLVLCGHSHVQLTTSGPRGTLIVNPGSVGCPRHVDNKDWTEAEAGSPHARYAIATRRQGLWNVELIVLGYDWSHVAERARENGRADWAEIFLSGWP
jgi:diadenosine tetraphosphatase ApaH/serine/threonine PP2A family protein phosphatase